ncbi:MAG TPA: Ku protein, partial [Actinomycetota bacterium]|nr:Ku protein [Actinomycetota bacterium]
IAQFVERSEIDPIYYKKTYYLGPEEAGVKAYQLLRDSLQEGDKVGVAKVTFRDKEHLAAIRLMDDVLVLDTMFWPDEIRPAEEVPGLEKDAKVSERELQMAESLIANLTENWNPDAYTDEYREALLEIVEKKVAGEEIEVIEAPEPTKVVDLMEALKASVDQTKKAPARKKSASRKKAAAS